MTGDISNQLNPCKEGKLEETCHPADWQYTAKGRLEVAVHYSSYQRKVWPFSPDSH